MILTLYVLIGLAFAFAISIGAHYTGACMGMPLAAGAIRATPALLLMAPLVLIGAAVASEGVESTVGHGILRGPPISLGVAIAIVAAALLLTSLYNFVTIPTSTIQILVFSVVGAGLGAGLSVQWSTIEALLVLWALAPVAAFGLGYLYARAATHLSGPSAPASPAVGSLALSLILVGAAASFAMGANDVSNASGALILSGAFNLTEAAILGGIGLAVGVLSWGRPLLRKIAFDVVRLDPTMAIGAQLAQSTVILTAVIFGYFTSMNQALVGAMLGTGLARGRSTVRWRAIRDLLVGWAIGPVSGLVLGFVFVRLVALA
jgi:PiT family inorganic phosphate transporter